MPVFSLDRLQNADIIKKWRFDEKYITTITTTTVTNYYYTTTTTGDAE